MKNFLILALLTVGCVSFSNAQTRIGGGFSYGTDVEEFGLNLNGEFFLRNEWAIAPEFNYFFANDPLDWWDFNADAHYYFVSSGAASLYGLGGFNLTTVSSDRNNGRDYSDTEFGLNLGIGANFDVSSKVIPFTQLKVILSDYDQAVLTFGLRFSVH